MFCKKYIIIKADIALSSTETRLYYEKISTYVHIHPTLKNTLHWLYLLKEIALDCDLVNVKATSLLHRIRSRS